MGGSTEPSGSTTASGTCCHLHINADFTLCSRTRPLTMSGQQQAHSAFSFEMTSAVNINPCFCFHSCSQRRRRQCELKGNTKRNPRSRPCLHLNIQNPWCSIPRTSTSMIFPAQTKSPIHRYRDCDSVKLSVTFGLCRVIYMTFSLSHVD